MRLDDYWGVGPKTRQLLTAGLGVEAAAGAIESGDARRLVANATGRAEGSGYEHLADARWSR